MNRELRNCFISNDLSSDIILSKALELGSNYLAGVWNKLEKEEVEVRQITGGQSNLLFLASTKSPKLANNEPNCFLIRIHCQPDPRQIFTDTVVFSVLAERGLGPKMYGFFDGGRLEEFLPSRTLNEGDIQIEENSVKIAAVYPNIHSIDIPISKKPAAIEMMRGWLKQYKDLGGEKHVIKPLYTKYETGQVPEFVTVENLEKEMDQFEKWSELFEDRIVFSHNDLAAMNILELDSTKEMIFIDFEYASYNWRGFDLGMHLSECAFDYRVDGMPGYKLDPQIFEGASNIEKFCASYIDKLYEGCLPRHHDAVMTWQKRLFFKLKSSDPDQLFPKTTNRQAEIESLVKECQFFWPLTNLFWAIWSIKSVKANHENGIDLESVSSDRLSVYYHLKPRSQKIYEELLKEAI